MSTICKIALLAQTDVVVPVIEAFLRERAFAFTLANSEWPAAAGNFIIGNEFPSIFSVKQVTPEVTEIHFNSFATLDDLASRLSSTLETNVVINIYQSVSTASYWALNSKGKQVRTIEAGDGEVRSHTGDRLPFEGAEPGGASDDDDGYISFDYHDQDWYNLEVGVPVEVYQDYDTGWVNFILPHNSKQALNEVVR